jgi:Bacterial cell division membrane protein
MWLTDSLREFYKRGDLLLLALCLLASCFGLLMIHSATLYLGPDSKIVNRQLIALALGVVVYIACSFVDIDLFLERSWKFLPVFNILMMVWLKLAGYGEETGNINWVSIPGIPFNIQPAEITKIAFIMLLAVQITYLNKRNLSSVGSVLQLLAHFGIMVGAIFLISGDAGMSAAYLLIFIIMLWLARLKLRWFALGFSVLIGGAYAVYNYTSLLPNYMRQRVAVVFDHSIDPLGIGYHQTRGILALGSGQFTGQGLFQGIQSQSQSGLPARHTDFILAVIGEELGMIGCIAIMLLLSAIILRCLFVSRSARSEAASLVCVGFGGMLLVQMVLNIGMCLYVLPVIGLTLPFVSYGGSSIISLFAAMGLVSSIKMRSLPSWLKDRTQT